MAFQISTIRDRENMVTYPRTLVEAVYNSLGIPLSVLLQQIDSETIYIQDNEPEKLVYKEWLKPSKLIKIGEDQSEVTPILEASYYSNQKYAVEIEGNIYGIDAYSENQASIAPDGAVILAETDTDNIIK